MTITDFVSQALICRILHNAFPRDPVMAVEDSALLREPGFEGGYLPSMWNDLLEMR